MAIVVTRKGRPAAIFTGNLADVASRDLISAHPGVYERITEVPAYEDYVPRGAAVNPYERIQPDESAEPEVGMPLERAVQILEKVARRPSWVNTKYSQAIQVIVERANREQRTSEIYLEYIPPNKFGSYVGMPRPGLNALQRYAHLHNKPFVQVRVLAYEKYKLMTYKDALAMSRDDVVMAVLKFEMKEGLIQPVPGLVEAPKSEEFAYDEERETLSPYMVIPQEGAMPVVAAWRRMFQEALDYAKDLAPRHKSPGGPLVVVKAVAIVEPPSQPVVKVIKVK